MAPPRQGTAFPPRKENFGRETFLPLLGSNYQTLNFKRTPTILWKLTPFARWKSTLMIRPARVVMREKLITFAQPLAKINLMPTRLNTQANSISSPAA